MNMRSDPTLRQERLKNKESLIGKLSMLLKTTRARKRESAKTRSAKSSSQKSSPSLNQPSLRMEPSLLLTLPRSTTVPAPLLSWLKRLPRKED